MDVLFDYEIHSCLRLYLVNSEQDHGHLPVLKPQPFSYSSFVVCQKFFFLNSQPLDHTFIIQDMSIEI